MRGGFLEAQIFNRAGLRRVYKNADRTSAITVHLTLPKGTLVMKTPARTRLAASVGVVAASAAILLAVTLTPRPLQAAWQWHAAVGAQSKDLGHQALAFLPNELWIHAGDTVTWTFEAEEIH